MPGVVQPGQELDYYQMRALQLVKHRRNVAILGGAGIGKSFVLSKIISAANQLLQKKHVVACSVTNNAARNIDGLTLHKLFRAKINWEWSVEGLWDQVKRHSSTRRVLSDAKILIIDEISTVKATTNIANSLCHTIQCLSSKRFLTTFNAGSTNMCIHTIWVIT